MTDKAHEAALDRAGNVFMWAINTGPTHPDATPEGAAMQIIRMYLAEMDEAGDVNAEALLARFPALASDATHRREESS